jgi:plastocyanin
MNYMLHNQTPDEQTVWITYDVDYVPATSALGRQMKPVEPVWMDVQNGKSYPVFDVHRGAGSGGRYTYPEQASPYPYQGAPANQWTFPRDATLIFTAGHVHPGGLYTDLDLIRSGASVRAARSVRCSRRRRRHRAHRHRRRPGHQRVRHSRARRCAPTAAPAGPVPGHEPNSVRVWRSDADYFDPAGPISWDMAMRRTPSDWRVGVHRGDRLAVSATYESSRASWYESMGIDIVYVSWGEKGPDPFTHALDTRGTLSHGHLRENDNHGGNVLPGSADPTQAADGQSVNNGVAINGFQYLPGGAGLPGQAGLPPVVHQGDQLRFGNFDAAEQIFHTVTACRAPCNRSTGLDYPLADGTGDYDSGDLGSGPGGFTAAAQREDWYSPKDLAPGTYTYFCRIHPFMRGSFRVVPR